MIENGWERWMSSAKRVSVEEIVSGNLVMSLMFRIKRSEPGIDPMMHGMENKRSQ